MGFGKSLSIRDPEGKPVLFPSGVYFCPHCCKLRKRIFYPFTDTIETCSCGCTMVAEIE